MTPPKTAQKTFYRPHHFFCTLGFQGNGYSQEFTENFKTIKDNLTDETVITVTLGMDDICQPCPNRQGGLCKTQSKIETLDQKHSEALRLVEGDELTWKEAKCRLAALSLEDHHRICKGCGWLKHGLCAQALQDLKS